MPVLSEELREALREKNFFIMGCGGVGAFFADMLVRTGAFHLHLVDGDKVEGVNLNRPPFTRKDIGIPKVAALEKHLMSINGDLKVRCYGTPFFTSSQIKGFTEQRLIKERQKTRDDICNEADVVIVAMDDFDVRQDCYQLCHDNKKDWLSIGLDISPNDSKYLCLFNYKYFGSLKRPEFNQYGPHNGSYCSIITEACSVGLNMLLHNLSSPDRPVNKVEKEYYEFINPINR